MPKCPTESVMVNSDVVLVLLYDNGKISVSPLSAELRFTVEYDLALLQGWKYRPWRRTHISLQLYFSEMMIRLGSKFAASVLVVTLDFAYTVSVRPLAFLCHLRRTIALK